MAIAAIELAFGDDAVSELHASGPEHLEVKANGDRYLLEDIRFSSEDEYEDFVQILVERAEAVHDWNSIVERGRGVVRMKNGSRLAVMMPPFVEYPTISVRKHNLVSFTPQDMIKNGTFTPVMMAFLQACVAAKANILFVGDMGSGKTSALSIMSHLFGDNERVLLLEEIGEIWIQKPLVTRITYLPTEPKKGLIDALDHVLYAGPDRVIVGEIHMEGITNMFEIMLAGSEGSMGTYHAGSAQQAIKRMKMAIQSENDNVTAETALERIQDAIDLVVVMEKTTDGHRCIEMSEIDWRQSNADGRLQTTKLFGYEYARLDEKGRPIGQGHHTVLSKLDQQESRIQRKANKNGVFIDPNWFVSAEDLRNIQAANRR